MLVAIHYVLNIKESLIYLFVNETWRKHLYHNKELLFCNSTINILMLIIQYSSNTLISIASCKHKDKVKQNLRNSSPVRDKDTARLNLFIFSVS